MARKYFKKPSESPAVESQAEANAEAAEDVREETVAASAAPKTPVVRRVAYKTLYAVSFGTVFTSLLLRKLLVPKNSVIESALHDGAVAAQHKFEEQEKVVEETIKETVEALSVAVEEEAPAQPA